MRRVLRPSGKLLLIEHVRADGPWRARLQDWLTPFWRRVAANCHPNRPSLVLLGDAGFAVQEMRRISTGLRLERPIVAGIASRQERPAFAP